MEVTVEKDNERRADIVVAASKLFGAGAFRLTPYKSVWVGWGAPATSKAANEDYKLEALMTGLGPRQRAFLKSRLLGMLTVGNILRAEAWRVLLEDNCVAIAWVDPHTELVTIQPTWSTP